MNIYEKMLAITGEIARVAKNLTVGEGKSAYRATGEADVLAAVRPLEVKYGVYSYPFSRTIVAAEQWTTKSEYNGNTRETTKQFLRVETVYRFVNVEKPDEYIEIISYGDGVDSQDKATGKAITYSDKYALLKAYKIMTGDDPDQIASPEQSVKADARPQAQERVQGQRCEVCGAEISAKVMQYSTAKFGKKLCVECQRKQ